MTDTNEEGKKNEMAEAFAEEKGTKSKKEKALVIVESPAKAKTIEKYLGDNYAVVASMGHLRDLPKSVIGIDVRLILSEG